MWQAQSHRTAIKGRGGRIPGTSAADLIAIPAKLPVIECPAPGPRSEGESVPKAIYSQPICNATAKPSSAGTVKASLAAIGIACVADRVSLRQTPKGRPHFSLLCHSRSGNAQMEIGPRCRRRDSNSQIVVECVESKSMQLLGRDDRESGLGYNSLTIPQPRMPSVPYGVLTW